jgi:L-asparaginase II
MSSHGAADVKILQSAMHGNTILYCFPHWARRQTAIFHYAMKKGKEQALSPDFQGFVTKRQTVYCTRLPP